MKMYSIFIIIVLSLGLAGCLESTYKAYELENGFGKSVHHLVAVQSLTPQPILDNSPITIDGYASGNIIRSYRNGFGQDAPLQAQPSISISAIGSGSSGQ